MKKRRRDGQAYLEKGNECQREGKVKAVARLQNKGSSGEVDETFYKEETEDL